MHEIPSAEHFVIMLSGIFFKDLKEYLQNEIWDFFLKVLFLAVLWMKGFLALFYPINTYKPVDINTLFSIGVLLIWGQ